MQQYRSSTNSHQTQWFSALDQAYRWDLNFPSTVETFPKDPLLCGDDLGSGELRIRLVLPAGCGVVWGLKGQRHDQITVPFFESAQL
jgi:hypothetical protein